MITRLRPIIVSLAAGLAIAPALAVAPPVSAAAGARAQEPPIQTYDWGCSAPARIRTGPHVRNTALGICQAGDIVGVHRRTSGDVITCEPGYTSSIWVYLTDYRTGVTGYISYCFLTDGVT
jgi:hypothetical protein